MATEIRRRRGSTADHATFTGAPAELTVDTDKNTVVVHDGATVGGWPVPTNIETLRDVTFTSAAEEDGLVRISGVWVNTSSVTSGLRVPAGTEAQRSVTGGFTIRFNTTAGAYEGYNGTSWVGLGAASADLVPYDNTASGLTATDVQAAIDEVEGRVDTVETGKLDEVGGSIDQLVASANSAPVKSALNASGDAPIFACRAWVNFDGTTTPPTIRASGNVSSVTRESTGRFTVNFTESMATADYSPLVSTSRSTVAAGHSMIEEMLSTSVEVSTWSAGDTLTNAHSMVSVIVI